MKLISTQSEADEAVRKILNRSEPQRRKRPASEVSDHPPQPQVVSYHHHQPHIRVSDHDGSEPEPGGAWRHILLSVGRFTGTVTSFVHFLAYLDLTLEYQILFKERLA